MSAINELKPCPFCGGEKMGVGVYSLGKKVAVVQCEICYAAAGFTNVEKLGEELAKEKAVQFWNTRRSAYADRFMNLPIGERKWKS